MAKLAQLIETVSSNSGIPLPTVSLSARHIREAGLITSGGRGPGGAEMKACDAANLLIGAVAATQVKDAAEVVRLFRAAKPIQAWGSALHKDANLSIPAFSELDFGQMLDALFSELVENGDVTDRSDGGAVDLEVHLERTGQDFSVTPSLVIRRDFEGRALREIYHYSRNHPGFEALAPDQWTEHAKVLANKGGRGLSVTAKIHDSLIFSIADCLAGRPPADEIEPGSMTATAA